MANIRINPERALTNAEKKRRFDDKAASIDEELDSAVKNIDWDRRNAAEKDLAEWMKTYGIGLLIDDPPPPRGEDVLRQMQNALTSHQNYMLCLPRGSGKSCYSIGAALFALATGLQKFVVIIANSARSASNLLNDLWRAVAETGSAFANDYPEVCLPFHVTSGSFRRRQLYKGQSTALKKNASELVLATLEGFKTSGSCVAVRGVSSGIRGLKHGTIRPSCVLLDDLQSTESAQNPEQVQKIIDCINKDVVPLAGKTRLSILQLATPICPEDVVERLLNDKAWSSTLYPAILKWPVNEELWENYFRIYDRECVEGGRHTESLDFYKANFEAMNEGAELFNPSRFDPADGHASGLQKLLELRRQIGDAAFQSEYQMKPRRLAYSYEINQTIVASKTGQHKRGRVPEGCVFVAAATDLNVSYGLTTSIVAFKPDMTAYVVDFCVMKTKISLNDTEAEYNRKVYEQLDRMAKKLKQTGVKLDAWAVDASGTPFDVVCEFAKNCYQAYGIRCGAFAGRANTQFNPYIRSRLRDAVGRMFVLCGDQAEHTKRGSGRKYGFFNADLAKEKCQKAFLAPVGSPGSCCLFDAGPDVLAEFAMQFCNERLLYVKKNRMGLDQYEWKTREPHDYLDTVAMCYAAASSQGLSGSMVGLGFRANGTMKKKSKRQVRVV